MEFLYDQQEMNGSSFLLCNGLGGYCSLSGAFSAPRCDQGILVAAVKAPNERLNVVHRLQEILRLGDAEVSLSTQEFSDGTAAEEGFRLASWFRYEYTPSWEYQVRGVRVLRQCAMAYGENTAAVIYSVENPTDRPCTLEVTPFWKFAPKETALTEEKDLDFEEDRVSCHGYTAYIHTNGVLEKLPAFWQCLSYPEDTKDGRPGQGLTGACCRIRFQVPAGQTAQLEAVFSMEPRTVSGRQLLQMQTERMKKLESGSPFSDPVARQLVMSADAYIARRDSTGEKTILAGYPLFSDWGRDTMIALPGCTLATGRIEDAKSILRTFLAYERDGLVPNLFPEGGQEPMYNTVDAALLLIDCVWQYWQHTGDLSFVREAWPVMERIIGSYRAGTRHAIGMDTDGLIFAGEGLDQVTWMDVCIQGILPTPRHGKPVEINAYWYNALKIMERLARETDADGKDYGSLAEKVKESFGAKFYIAEKGYLRDVLSGTEADDQIRCNQIWALAMPFTMLAPHQQKQVLDTVSRHLLTRCGLRTLSPEDRQYQPFYGGSQLKRDMAYHQGTTWVFPMGAYYRAYLRVNGSTLSAAREVRQQLTRLMPMLRQGCAGQLPEIYDGDHPYEGKGCFAQAWSVGEMLRVYEDIHKIETSEVENSGRNKIG